jgi:hypothetical protein
MDGGSGWHWPGTDRKALNRIANKAGQARGAEAGTFKNMDSSFTRGFAGQPAWLQSIVAGRLWRNYDDSCRRALEKNDGDRAQARSAQPLPNQRLSS